MVDGHDRERRVALDACRQVKRRGGCRGEVAGNACWSATAVTPPHRWWHKRFGLPGRRWAV